MANKKLEVHLETKNLITAQKKNRAHKINDKMSFSFEEKGVQMFHDIIDYLDVEKSPRYKREPTKTFCNIYAYDFCSFTWAYLPRVYWNKKALAALAEGVEVKTLYGKTVRELSANMLYDFLVGIGKTEHDWEEIQDTLELQKLANEGHVCIICAKHKNARRSGHITIVAPEQENYKRKGLVPVQSQAGANNYKYKSGNNWYLSKSYSDYGFFVNRRPSELTFKE
ncbi:MAG: hypothetical protein ACRBFS_26575 [Aureispira sp.]